MMELIKTPRVYVDKDGVLADFNRHVFDLIGVYPDDIPDDDMWDWINAEPNFWPTMPLKHGAHEIWAMVQPYNPIILTGCPKANYDQASAQKIAWGRKHFGAKTQIITCLSRNKPLHMDGPGAILIDDMSRNLRKWVQAGGIGVHYRKFDQVVADFKATIERIMDGENV